MPKCENCEKLRRQIRIQQESLEKKNRALDALHYVWCSGGCTTGVHRHGDPDEITEELVLEAERNTKRLRIWWENRKFRKETGKII
jgi:hypothetical protein